MHRELKIDATDRLRVLRPLDGDPLLPQRRPESRIGFSRVQHGEASYRGDLMTHRISFNPFLQHASQIFHDAVRGGMRLPAESACRPSMYKPPEEVPTRRRFARAEPSSGCLEIEDDPARERWGPTTLAAALVAQRQLRRPAAASGVGEPERYVELAQPTRSSATRNVAIAFTGSPSEARRVAEPDLAVRAIDSPRCVSLAGKTSLDRVVRAVHASPN